MLKNVFSGNRRSQQPLGVGSSLVGCYNHDLIDFLLERTKIEKHQKVLDVGFGDGYLLSKLDCEKFGIEKGDDFIENDFDFIFMLDVIEHLSIEQVQEYFEYFKRTLKPTGKIFISTPNIKNLYQQISFWDEPSHLRPYTFQTMTSLAKKYGFSMSVIKFHYFKNPLKILVNLLLGLEYHNKNIFELKVV